MPFNDNKCHAIAFGNKTSLPFYKLGNTSLEWVEKTKYLSVIIQTNLKFDKHIEHKTKQASKVLGMVKFTLYDAPRQGLYQFMSLDIGVLRRSMGPYPQENHKRHRDGAKSWCEIYI